MLPFATRMPVRSTTSRGAALLLLLFVGSAAATYAGSAEPRLRLVAVPGAAGISFVPEYGGSAGERIIESAGAGAGWIDYDVDGDVDLVLANGLPEWGAAAATGSGHALFRNEGERFRRAPRHHGIGDRRWGAGVAVADVDNDGFPDLLITAIGADRLYRNNGDGTFSPVDAGLEDDGWGTSAVFTDWDGDGFVDLYVARYVVPDAAPSEPCFYLGSEIETFCGPRQFPGLPDLFYRNVGDGSFERWFEDEVDPDAAAGFALVATDCDDDLRPEIYVANDLAINHLYRRTAGGGVDDFALLGGSGYSGNGREQAGMAATAADVDADGLFDLFVTNFENDHNTLYRNLGDCSFEDATARYGLMASGIPYMGWGAIFVDLDGDGDQDLFVANGHIFPQLEVAGVKTFGQRNLLYANQLRETGAPGFVEVSGEGLEVGSVASSRGVARGDYDDDGDADIIVTNVGEGPTLLRNDSELQARALQLALVGRRSNRMGYGTRVRVLSDGVRQELELRGSDGFQGSNDPRLLIYLPDGVAEAIEIEWPRGGRTVLRGQQPGRVLVVEGRGVVARRPW